MPDSHPAPLAGSDTSPDHGLSDMERFFDSLFNHHMVLPQTPEDPRAGHQDPAHDNPGVTPV
jgi:hypothetical protein